jgi:DNA-binding NtrC family response regulator
VASSQIPVLILGETGTGKELIAKAIHQLSPRRSHPLVTVHCAALPPTLLESELFGHEKGSFTGAHERRLGRFELAQGGTLFLDEIGEIDASTQVKLLRFLSERTFERVGSSKSIAVDVRVLAATNRDLTEEVKTGAFREDLFFRLRGVKIQLPPLRERRSDIPLLVQAFVQESARANGKKIKGVSADTMEALTTYSWPGNVRELYATIEGAVVLSRGDTITLTDLASQGWQNDPSATGLPSPGSLIPAETVRDAEQQLIIRALKEANGNRTTAARRIGMSRRTLHRKLKEYSLEHL